MSEPIHFHVDTDIEKQIAEAARELRMRHGVYAKWVKAGRMGREEAAEKIALMAAIVESLTTLRDLRRLFTSSSQEGTDDGTDQGAARGDPALPL